MQLKGKTEYKAFDKLCFYDDPHAQMNNGTKFSVTNIVEILRDIKWYNNKFNKPIHMKHATSGNIIVPAAQGWFRVQANTKQGYLDILYFYSLHFTSTLLSDRYIYIYIYIYILRSSSQSKEFFRQVMTNYFDLNNKRLYQDLKRERLCRSSETK